MAPREGRREVGSSLGKVIAVASSLAICNLQREIGKAEIKINK